MKQVSAAVMKEGRIAAPVEAADRLSCAMQFIRAVETRRWSRARSIAAVYPDLKELLDLSSPNPLAGGGLDKTRDLALRLAKETLLAEIRDLQAQMPDLPDHQRMIRRQGITTKLQRLRPGKASSLSSVRNENNQVCVTPEEMAKALASHWSKTFQGRDIDAGMLENWLNLTLPLPPPPGEPTLPPPDSPQWRMRRRDVARAVRMSGNSAPGPDGIPYLAWRRLGETGIDILWGMAQDLTGPNAIQVITEAYRDEAGEGHDFNLGILCCLPKKPSGHDEDGEPYYTPGNTRPLSIVNCDNRLIASAARIRWETPLNRWVSKHQRGFLPNRSMLANVIDVDYESMRVSLTHEAGAIILFDFEAAFPSVAHDFIFGTLRHLGLPQEALNLITALYDQNKCLVSAQGNLHPGFPMRSGIRQGCPLSPLLFVVVVDSLLRHLAASLPTAVPRAYADDIGLVTEDFLRDLPHLQRIFGQFQQVSGLRLNLPKTAIIPLGDTPPEKLKTQLQELDMQHAPHGHLHLTGALPPLSQAQRRAYVTDDVPHAIKRARLQASAPVDTKGRDGGRPPPCTGKEPPGPDEQPPHLPWGDACFTTWALYLGFAIGPGKADHSWDRAIASLRARMDMWPWSQLGMQYATHAYNVFAFSVMGFVAQLENPSDQALAAEREAVARVAPGPYNWNVPEDMWRLQQSFGFPFRVKSLSHMAKAAQIRVILWENHANGGIQVLPRARALTEWMSSTDFLGRRIRFDKWYNASHLLTLRSAWDDFRSMGLTAVSLFNSIARSPRPWTAAATKRVRSGTQGEVYNRLLSKKANYGLTRLEEKIERWDLGNSRIVAERVLPRLQAIAKWIPPRVHAATFSTLWNRWCTARRYQMTHSSPSGCLLGCTSTRCLDEIEHYLRCPVVLQVARDKLGLQLTPDSSWEHLLLAGRPPDPRRAEQWWGRCALLLYATYRTTNAARHRRPLSPMVAAQALRQAIQEGAKNHPKATRLVDGHGAPNQPMD